MNLKLDWQHVAIFATASIVLLALVVVATTTKDTALASALMSVLVPALTLWGTTVAALLKGSTESTATAMLRASKASPDNLPIRRYVIPVIPDPPPTKPTIVPSVRPTTIGPKGKE